MDRYTLALLDAGLRGMIGKGSRSEEVREALKQHRAVYLAVTGGAAALITRTIQAAEVIAYHDLGPEAVQRLQVLDLLAIVINDIYGGDAYQEGQSLYRSAAD
jgi:fumarate hydratase subunit beta